MKVSWITDIHLNFLSIEKRKDFYRSIVETHCDAIFITGDIADAKTTEIILLELAQTLGFPIYFVLGNHDYYGNSIVTVREEITALSSQNNLLYWLPEAGPQALINNTVIVGQDGWADGRVGDYHSSHVVLNDSNYIVELFNAKIQNKQQLLQAMQQLADEDAYALTIQINNAITQYQPKKIIVLTHVPPFRETCLYEGKISSDAFLPFFCSKATGQALSEAANNHPNIAFLVLCGHTHAAAHLNALDNLSVHVGAAEYGRPGIQQIIEI